MMVYLAHPVGHEPQRSQNLANLKVWFKFLIDHTDWSISVPWHLYVSTLDEETYRERGIRDDLHGLSRCDAVVLCGSHVSSGMLAEMEQANKLGLPIIDLTGLGKELPEPELVGWLPADNVVLPGRVGRVRRLTRELLDHLAAVGLTNEQAWASWEIISRKAESLGQELYAMSDEARKNLAKATQLSLPL